MKKKINANVSQNDKTNIRDTHRMIIHRLDKAKTSSYWTEHPHKDTSLSGVAYSLMFTAFGMGN